MLNTRKQIIKNEKGLTLTEIIVSIAIMAVVVAPFLGSFLSAAQNNVLSKDIFSTSALLQQAMEDIKSRPDFLDREAKDFLTVTGFREYSPAPQDARIKINYRIDYERQLDDDGNDKYEKLPSGSMPYNPLKDISSSLDFFVTQSNVTFKSSSLELAAKTYQLSITGSLGAYNYTFRNEDGSYINTGAITPQNSKINIMIQFDPQRNSNAEEFRVKVNLENTLDKDVNFYIIDESASQSGVRLTNTGTKTFSEFNNISSKQIPEYSNILYRIEVTAAKDNTIVNRLVSFVKK